MKKTALLAILILAAAATEIANTKEGDNRFTIDPQICGSTQAQAATQMNVSERLVNSAAALACLSVSRVSS